MKREEKEEEEEKEREKRKRKEEPEEQERESERKKERKERRKERTDGNEEGTNRATAKEQGPKLPYGRITTPGAQRPGRIRWSAQGRTGGRTHGRTAGDGTVRVTVWSRYGRSGVAESGLSQRLSGGNA